MIPDKYTSVAKDVVPTFNIRTFVSAFRAERDAAFAFEGEAHDFWEMVYIDDGYAYAIADETICPLSAGQIIFHKPMEFHKLHSMGKPFKSIIISFDADGAPLRALENHIFTLSDDEKEILYVLYEKGRSLLYFCEGEDVPDEEMAIYIHETSAILQLFLIRLIRKNIGVSVFDVSAQERVYRDILCVMNECCNENLSLNEIARRCAMSSSNLKKIFAKHNHIGIMKYFLLLRLKQAMFLLSQNMSVADVSEALSFPNQNYFSVVFKRELGCTPTQYVSEMQNPTRHSITRDT